MLAHQNNGAQGQTIWKRRSSPHPSWCIVKQERNKELKTPAHHSLKQLQEESKEFPHETEPWHQRQKENSLSKNKICLQ